MGEVIHITPRNNTAYLAGKAYCLQCQYEWEAVSPVGALNLECPKCESSKGRFRNEVIRGEEHWQCMCGNEYFNITKKGIYCGNCGEWQDGY